ncbi:MAG: LEA type 2 family protein [Bacteroidales bacterium]|nr:LEA type 2 family protein [Bacteroidales bacterium]
MKFRQLTFLIAITIFFFSCDLLNQVEGMKMLSKCEFRINTVTDIRLAEVNISNIQKISDVKPLEMLQLTNAYLNKQLPLNFNLNLLVKNPNDQPASLNRLEWILFIDDSQLLEGVINQKFVTNPGETASLPLKVGFNLADVIEGDQINKIINYAMGLTDGSGKTTRIMIKLKPSVMIGQQSIMYPGWIEVRNEFTAQ